MAENIVIGIAILALLLYRQLKVRSVKTDRAPRLLIVLGVIGIVQLANFVSSSGSIGAAGVIALVVSLGVAAALSTVRAYSMKLWVTADGWFRQGTAITLVLWIVSIASHLGIELLAGHLAKGEDIAGLGNATLVLYLAVSLGLQNVVVARRVAILTASGQAPTVPAQSR